MSKIWIPYEQPVFLFFSPDLALHNIFFSAFQQYFYKNLKKCFINLLVPFNSHTQESSVADLHLLLYGSGIPKISI